ncbi:CDP-glycerol glycerophosphotransferase family protein [Shinella sp. M27]|uniref:CDP-glycerol glycerophosphotransferase family protein n=1 Tax=Shinella sp. M27 TaxID=3368614 RepID=UPI003B9EE2E2
MSLDLLWPRPNDYRAIVYFGDATAGAEHIYRQWVDVFEESGIPYFALFRQKSMFDFARRDRPEAAVAFARNGPALAEIIKNYPKLQVAFHTGNPGNIAQMMQYHHFKHVFIGHGDSDKATSSSRMFRLYDEVWVAGQAHADRLNGVLPDDISLVIVGRPQVASSFAQERDSEINLEPAFAYLPTWEGSREEINYASVPMTEAIAGSVAEIGGVMRVKFHPSNGARLKKFRDLETKLIKSPLFSEGRNEVVQRKFPAPSLMDACDYCITDVSSIISDWIVRDRPIFVYKPVNVVLSQSAFPLESYCYTFRTIEELQGNFKRVILDKDDYKAEERTKASNYLVSRTATMSNEFARRAQYLSSDEANMPLKYVE